ncbi:hypothetical protein K488DRAFT_46628 [Vararia minispora EC-137]|uniref:Uncharacterized protein n=1 Tax=Vararia minispora EC-137 TaxID=1314806 RepID=A0ACB8QR77_9AGAM|nr:hypothetical protein K488DRAFT_46628 [Vararia minispora EC-137]
MESNKDEALRALALAQRKRDTGDVVGARKLANKSLALFATPEAQRFLDSLPDSSSSSSFTAASSTASEPHPSAAGARHRTKEKEAPEKKREYTAENVAVVKRVRACRVTEYYGILDLKRDCEESDVKKAYRKLALALHPDKNGAPGADEAFKMVSKAFQVLSDPDKRAQYDRHGSDPESRFSGMSSRASSASFANGSPFGGGGGMAFDGEISPEDLFNMFFGSGMGGQGTTFGGAPGACQIFASFGQRGFTTTRVYTNGPRQRGGAPQQQEPLTPRQLLTNLLPILILFAFTIFSALPSVFSTSPPPDPHFAFTPSTRFNVERHTSGLGVTYHVNSAEFATHPIAAELARSDSNKGKAPALMRFEEHVDRTYAHQKYAECQRGMDSKRRRREAKIGLFGIGTDWEEVTKIDQENVEACEFLKAKGLLN